MKIEKLLKESENAIYGMTFNVDGVEMKRCLPFAEKVGLAKRMFLTLVDEEVVFDEINGKMFVPVFLFKNIVTNVDFPDSDEDIDVDGVYDFLYASGILNSEEFKSELNEVNDIINGFKNMEYRKKDSSNPLMELLERAMGMSYEEIDELRDKVEKLSKDENVKKMINFSRE